MLKIAIYILKFTIAIICMYVACIDMEWGFLKTLVKGDLSIFMLLSCTAIIILQNFLTGIRLWLIAKRSDTNLTKFECINSCFVGLFFSQVLFSFLGGDVVRGWYIHKKTTNVLSVTNIILLDRILGFIGLSILYFFAFYSLSTILKPSATLIGLQITAIFCLTLILGFIVCILISSLLSNKYLKPLQKLLLLAKILFLSWRSAVLIIAVSILINLLNVMVIYLSGKFYGASLSFYACLIVAIPVILISMAPITVAGWGIRENAMVAGFGVLHIHSEIALATSITYGVALILASFPGLYFAMRKTLALRSNVHKTLDISTA